MFIEEVNAINMAKAARILGEFNDKDVACRNIIIYVENECDDMNGITVHGDVCKNWDQEQWEQFLQMKIAGFDRPKRVVSLVVTFGNDMEMVAAEITDLSMFWYFDRIIVEIVGGLIELDVDGAGRRPRKASEVMETVVQLPTRWRSPVWDSMPKAVKGFYSNRSQIA